MTKKGKECPLRRRIGREMREFDARVDMSVTTGGGRGVVVIPFSTGNFMESTTAGGVMKALGVMMAVVAVLVSAPGNAAAQADLTGMWDLTVMTDQGDQIITLDVVQDGHDLTATGDTEFGSFEMTGTIDGSDVRFQWELDMQGTPLDIVFTGTLADGMLSGTADFGGMSEGDWTAERVEN